MPRITRPPSRTIVQVVPRDGAIEITLNINISVDGQVTASSDQAEVRAQKVEEDDKVDKIVPDFFGGTKLKFGKET